MDIKKIKAIIELVTESGIAELEISEGEDKLRIATTNNNIVQYTHNPATVQQNLTTSQIVQNSNLENNLEINNQQQSKIEAVDQNNYITSPMVGTFYKASSPTATPFVEIGQEVKVGQVLCIIEAMKLMNQIESEKNGIIKEILVKDGTAVEYGQKLFIIG